MKVSINSYDTQDKEERVSVKKNANVYGKFKDYRVTNITKEKEIQRK